MMNLFYKSICLSAGVWLYLSSAVIADEIILTTGERFTSSEIWEEDGKIKFNMQGLIVGVNKTDVAQIISSDGTSKSLVATPPADNGNIIPTKTPKQPVSSVPSTPQPQISRPLQPQPKLNQQKPPERPSPQPAASRNRNVRGIGFKGLAWKMERSKIEGLEKIETDPAFGGIDQYYRPHDSMQLDSALLDGIAYGFWRDKLYIITMWANGHTEYTRLRKEIFKRFGRGQQNNPEQERYIWLDRDTDRMLEFDKDLNTAIFWMRSRQLHSQVKHLYPDG